MKRKSIVVLFALAFVLSMILGACQAQTIEVEKTVVVEKEVKVESTVVVEKEVIETVVVEASSGDEAMKAALDGKMICGVFPGPINDAGWTTSAYMALNHMRDSYGMEIAYREHVLPEETEDVLREYAEAGCDVLFAHGFEYFDQVNQVATEYPDKQFIQTSRGTGQEPNIIGLSFKSGEEGYFAGMEACLASQTGTVGYIVGQTYPNLEWNRDMALIGFDDLVNEGLIEEPCTIEWLEVGSWDDPAKAKELTAAAIEQGVDAFIMVADAGDSGVIEAIGEANEAGKQVWGVSGVADKNYLGPEYIFGGYEELIWKEVELAMAAMVDAGGATYADLATGMREGSITLGPIYGMLSAEGEKFVMDAHKCYVEEGEECEMIGDIEIRTDL